ncbi:hypothetical protein WICMUC_000973 [Wickerhamomyces mucosus]|uniref:Uncharacterized protein n=1 Tax=Wickerhamomyces mucosus TaxID=1378264 RepID=A0A9P8TH66_9ASCO|nr:hypothetical protein WICMUC_000973 [Wickerhamomyces mucosus]
MLGFSLITGGIRKAPKVLVLILLFISVFILSFLLLGGYETSDTYSSIFLIKYQFNQSNPIYPLIQNSFSNSNTTSESYDEITVKANYLYVCLGLNETINCQSRSNIYNYQNLTNVQLYTASSSTSSNSINPIQIAAEFTNGVIHPYLLILTIILAIILFLTILYNGIPGMPFKYHLTKFNIGLSLISTLISGLTSIWGHIASKSGKELVEMASMNIIEAHIGKKAAALHWTPFSFLCIVSIGLIISYIKQVDEIIETYDPKV